MRDILAFGLFTGIALGVRSLGLLLFVYLALAIVIYLPWRERGEARLRFAATAALKPFAAVALAWLIMNATWPWAALSPLNPIRGLFAFSEFHYAIRTVFEGQVYEMGDVPRLYVPGYLLIRVPLITLTGGMLAVISMLALPPRGRRGGAILRCCCRQSSCRSPVRSPCMGRPSRECAISCSCCPRSRRLQASASTRCSTGSRCTAAGLPPALPPRSAPASSGWRDVGAAASLREPVLQRAGRRAARRLPPL